MAKLHIAKLITIPCIDIYLTYTPIHCYIRAEGIYCEKADEHKGNDCKSERKSRYN